VSKTVERVWTPIDLIRWTDGYLAEKGFTDSRLDAELLLAGVLGLKRLDLYLQFERPLADDELAGFKAGLKRRLQREPLQYISGTASFRNLELRVDRRVLIPRPETELLVSVVLDWAADRSGLDLVDIGTGSGAVALSLCQEGDFGRVVATDCSAEALDLARANAEDSVPAGGIEFLHGSVFDPLVGERFDIIVSNPPYIADRDREVLDAEVAQWEPETALFAGTDGLEVIRELVHGAPAHLRAKGLLAMEIGATQADAVAALIESTGSFGEPRIRKDFAGRDRIIVAERRAPAEFQRGWD
jgi:release factor glutamine methyltransferase